MQGFVATTVVALVSFSAAAPAMAQPITQHYSESLWKGPPKRSSPYDPAQAAIMHQHEREVFGPILAMPQIASAPADVCVRVDTSMLAPEPAVQEPWFKSGMTAGFSVFKDGKCNMSQYRINITVNHIPSLGGKASHQSKTDIKDLRFTGDLQKISPGIYKMAPPYGADAMTVITKVDRPLFVPFLYRERLQEEIDEAATYLAKHKAEMAKPRFTVEVWRRERAKRVEERYQQLLKWYRNNPEKARAEAEARYGTTPEKFDNSTLTEEEFKQAQQNVAFDEKRIAQLRAVQQQIPADRQACQYFVLYTAAELKEPCKPTEKKWKLNLQYFDASRPADVQLIVLNAKELTRPRKEPWYPVRRSMWNAIDLPRLAALVR